VCARGRAVAAAETSSSGVDGARWSREQWGLREFCDEKQNAMDRLLFIGSKLSAMVLNYNCC
jgi:hypothetical protein